MGTNYYHRPAPCPTCGHGEETHIGKSSAGWTFSFHGTEQIRSWSDWLAVLREGGEIRNEYDRIVTLEEFVEMVEAKRGERLNHTTYCRESDEPWTRAHGLRDCWLDKEGHSFSSGEFS